jgi:vacuolar-type H+-ATPase subunit H
MGKSSASSLTLAASVAAFTALAIAQAPTAGAQASAYSIDGLSLGTRVSFDSAGYKEYQCEPSQQFAGLTLCKKSRAERGGHGQFTSSHTILHAADGTVVYVNRYWEPAFFSTEQAGEEIRRVSRKYGQQPRIITAPRRPGSPDGTIAAWGGVVLEPLDASSLSELAAGKNITKGYMIDFISNFAQSARSGMPIYRLTGTAGLVWASSYSRNGRGTLRFVAIDASAFASASATQTTVPTTIPPPQVETTHPEGLSGIRSEEDPQITQARTEVDRRVAEAQSEANRQLTQVQDEAQARVRAAEDDARKRIAEAEQARDAARTEAAEGRSDLYWTMLLVAIGGALAGALTMWLVARPALARRSRTFTTGATPSEDSSVGAVVPAAGVVETSQVRGVVGATSTDDRTISLLGERITVAQPDHSPEQSADAQSGLVPGEPEPAASSEATPTEATDLAPADPTKSLNDLPPVKSPAVAGHSEPHNV